MKTLSTAALRLGLITLALSLLITCRKDKKPPAPALPRVTQEGKNTFGCYVNGKLFLPEGNAPGPITNMTANIDPWWHDGSFGITAYNTYWGDDIQLLAITVGGDSIKGTGVYPLTYKARINGTYSIIYEDEGDSGYHFAMTGQYPTSAGYLKINRYDYDNGVVSGEFEFTIIGAPFQDTIKVTQGRFDYQFR